MGRAPRLQAAFGTEALLDVVTELHGVCDATGARILQRYAATRNLARTARSVSHKAQGGAAAGAPGANPREVRRLAVAANGGLVKRSRDDRCLATARRHRWITSHFRNRLT